MGHILRMILGFTSMLKGMCLGLHVRMAVGNRDSKCTLFPQAGMIIDNGVKTTEASAKDKRPFLSIISARY